MRLIAVGQLLSGMRSARPIFADDGRVLLKENVELTDAYIRRLKELGYSYIYIDDPETCDIRVEDSVSMETRQEVVSRIKTLYDRMADPNSMNNILRTGVLGREFVSLFQMLFDELMDNHVFTMHLGAIYSSDAYLYVHCMNVGIYSCILGMANGYDRKTIQQLGVGAMLHDIGKILVDRSILDKPGKLTDAERKEMERHPWLGYKILSQQADISSAAAHCALQHHEKYDGTGYPRQLKGMEIHEFGRLLSVPDVYDALTSNRSYRKAFLPHECLEFLYSGMNTHFDPHFVDLFDKHINIYPVGMPVELSNGTSGIIARVNESNLHRPVVRVLEEAGQDVSPYETDLMLHQNIIITSCDLESVRLATA